MIPVKLKITGFLSYLQATEVDFAGVDLACITGSNGSGKSSLLDAMTWALFGQARRRDDALINSLAVSAEVVFDFDYESERYRIQRSKVKDKTGILEFYIRNEAEQWLPLTEHSLRETEARIQQTLRLDYETFTNASFFLQGKADQFSQQKPSDRKRILGSILGLETWELYKNQATEQRKNQEVDLNITESQLADIAIELNDEPRRIAHLAQLEQSLTQFSQSRTALEANLESIRRVSAVLAEQRRMVEMLDGQASATQTRHGLLALQIADRSQEKAEYQSEVAAADQIQAAYAAWQESVKVLESWEKTAATFHQQEGTRRAPLLEIESQRARLEEELRNLRASQQQIEERKAQIPLLQAQIDELTENQSVLHARLERRAELETEMQTIRAAQAEIQAENRRLKAEMDEIKERLDQLKAVSGANCSLCGKPLSPEERDALIIGLQADGENRGNRHRQNVIDSKSNEARLSTLQNELNNLRQVENDLRQLSAKIASLAERRDQLQKTVDEWGKASLPRLAEVQRKLNTDDYAADARAELARVDAALKALGYDAAAHDAARLDEQNRRSSQDALRRLEIARSALVPLEREISGLQSQLAALALELDQQEKAAQAARTQYELLAADQPDLHQAEDDLYHIQEQENKTRMEVGGARQAVEVLKTQKTRQVELQAARAELTQQIGRLKQLERAFSKDGIPALLIEQALPEIEEQANMMLDRLSNGNMSVNFVTQRGYKDRAREDKKETLDILINDATGTREYEMFSGGEAFRVNFAIRLALSRVLSQRAGAKLQLLVIDEGFGSQDADGIQRLTEAINLVRQDFAKILVITHLESMKDAFPSRIEVEKTPQGSTVKVVNL